MQSPRPITIVGGGLAGLALGIGLRQRSVPVAVWEAGRYPRHRVCGEFICGRGPSVLDRLQLRSVMEQAGAIQSTSTRFVAGRNSSPVRQLPSPALCLSRYEMDAALAREFQRLGGELRSPARWSNPSAEGVVLASGRRAQATEGGWRWFGLKVHAREVELSADLEMHVSSRGYVGVNRVNGGCVNVCGLFRSRHGERLPENRLELLRGEPGSLLFESLKRAHFDESTFCAVAGLALRPRRASEAPEVCIGDALSMIPPVTGNGMSMAFESAEIAIETLAAYSRGDLSWREAQQTIRTACDAAFERRLAWARALQWLMFAPALRGVMGGWILNSDALWNLFFSRTR